ncbi:R2 protein [Beet curly top virus]|uniref:R2 protein n=1 Tax=Beet curly top virus TaxID=10840 RepID=A5HDX3_9GEMI|nr:R2 protein [Beet curly top virus]
MGPYRVDQFPDNYPRFLAAATSCLLSYNKSCIQGVRRENKPLTIEEGEAFLQFQKDVKKLLKRKCSFQVKKALYVEIYKRYVPDVSKEEGDVSKGVAQEKENDYHY